MSVHYSIIARDSDMIVFETLVNKDKNQRQLRSECMEIITVKESENKSIITKMNSSMNKSVDSENPDESQLWTEPLTRITGNIELNLLL